MECVGQADALLSRLAEHGADAGVGVLNKGSSVAVEVDALLGVEGHVLARIYLEDEVLQGA